MGQRGPKPLPDNVHKLLGNPSKKDFKRVDLDGIHPLVEIPEPPAHLVPDARVEWVRISIELEKYGLITALDRAALAVYCQAYARWVHAEKKLAEMGDDGLVGTTPSGYKQIGVWLQISNRAAEQMHKFLAEFGMTPSARSRVTASQLLQADLFNDDASSSSQKAAPVGAQKYFQTKRD